MPAVIEHEPDAEQAHIRIFLVDDHDLVRGGLRSLLGREDDMVIVGEASSGDEALELLGDIEADVAIVDYRMPGIALVDLCREIAERRLRAQVIVLSAFISDDAVDAAFLAGARAYIVKDVEATDLKRAIRAVYRGESFLDPKVTPWVMSWAARHDRRGRAVRADLGARELRLLRLLAAGLSNNEISEEMALSPQSVKTYVRDLCSKMGVRTRVEAVGVALKEGVIAPRKTP